MPSLESTERTLAYKREVLARLDAALVEYPESHDVGKVLEAAGTLLNEAIIHAELQVMRHQHFGQDGSRERELAQARERMVRLHTDRRVLNAVCHLLTNALLPSVDVFAEARDRVEDQIAELEHTVAPESTPRPA